MLLVRHGEAEINKARSGDAAAIGHTLSPLTPKGRSQSVILGRHLGDQYDFTDSDFSAPVAASEYLRPQQTAEHAGFKAVHIQPILNELDVPLELVPGRRAVEKHASERWIPDDQGRAREFIERVRTDDLDYQVFFTHGLFIAAVRLAVESEVGVEAYPNEFDPGRGYIPLQTGVVLLSFE